MQNERPTECTNVQMNERTNENRKYQKFAMECKLNLCSELEIPSSQ